jgi:L-2-hydroxyglutarate oxidase LhgO
MIAVIGGGVVGLATAYELARAGREVCVLERLPRVGLGSSTHNSGVIHAGLYHPPDSLKTRYCIEGRERLFAFAAEHGVPAVRCGKLITAADAAEEAALDALFGNASANGVALEELSAAQARAREPHVHAVRALWSPLTGWIDAEAYVRTLRRAAESHGAICLVGTAPVAVERSGELFSIVTERERIDAIAIVNAAGLYADEVSALCGGERFRIYPCRGEYAQLSRRAQGLVRGLVYPPPHHSGHGLGVHLTRTIDGEVWIGPTISYQASKEDYESDRPPIEAFLEPTRRLLPAIVQDDLMPGPSGIRSKLHPPTERFADFRIGPDAIQPGLYQAAGIDSPGLTASLAIGAAIAAMIP